MNRQHWWNNGDWEKPKDSDKNLSHYYLIDRESHMDCPRTESVLPRRKASD